MKNKLIYEFGVPQEVIWGGHIVMGVFFIYIGYELIMKRKIPEYVVFAMMLLGALAFFYHIHIWYENF